MNRKLLIVFCLVFGAILAACGGSDSDSDSSSDDSAALQSQIDELQAQLDQANEDKAMAEQERDDALADSGSSSDDGDAMDDSESDTLKEVLARGTLNCGVPAGVSPGFGFLEEDGSWTGFDVDFCRVVAAGVLGDANAVEFRGTTSTDRFPVLQSREVDMLSRQTTWTTSRDTSLGFDFGPTTFYDGQGMMVKADSGITDLEGLDGGTVCVSAGTTTEKNLADVMRQLGIDYEPVVFDEPDAPRAAFEEGRCDGYTTDKSGLVSVLVLFDDPSSVTILDATMSKEPLGPLYRHGDNNWGDVVNWSTYCTIQAEELGVTQANAEEMLGSDNPQILNMLGVEGDLGQAMGLNNDFCFQIISQMGNYGEIFDKNLGPDTPFNLGRGVNAQWTDGGVLYSPPFR